MAGFTGSTFLYQHISVSSRNIDPRAAHLLKAAHDLGITALESLVVTDLIFLRGDINTATRDLVESMLVDPLLQIGHWNLEPPTADFVIETALHPGVTDATINELTRLAERMSLAITGVASGKRFTITGQLSQAQLQQLTSQLLANPIIERWSIDEPITPAFIDADATANIHVEQVQITIDTSEQQLAQINKQRGLALDPQEMLAIQQHFVQRGRLPTDVELETIAQTWSEHCAHKTFRAAITTNDGKQRESLINQLRTTTNAINAPFVRNAFVGNAGIISFSPGRTLALKCETHNHPSAIEPFGGANTGVGGVIRDVMGAQHHPIACTNILCFGNPNTDPLSLPDGVFPPLRTRDGVIGGIADYGNKIGLPTVAGAVLYDPAFTANPLVFAGCIGVSDSYVEQLAPQANDRVIVLGGRTGRDGLRGATFSSMTMDATSGDVSGASVQIGDPIIEKLLIDVLQDAKHLYRSITDCGAGGLSSAIGEMAEGVGADIELARAPLKYPGLAPWEIWLSEAQERMVLAIVPDNCAQLQAFCAMHGVEYVDLGYFTGDSQLTVRYNAVPVLQLDTHFLHSGRPQRQMQAVMPIPQRNTPTSAPEWLNHQFPTDILLALLGHPNIASKANIIHRYDHEIRGATMVRPLVGAQGDGHGDGVVLAEPTDEFGIAIGIGVNPWYAILDAERMALAAVDEAIRNVVAVGADPDKVALLDNFSWGNPQRHTTLGDLVAAVDGCCQGALVFGAPFVSGKDSLNNEYTGSDGLLHSVPPTLVITAVAHVPNVHNTVTADLKQAGNVLLLAGITTPEFGASHASMVCQQPILGSGVVPEFDLTAPQRYRSLHNAITKGLVASCHDVSEGGIAVALSEMCIGGRLGARLNSPQHTDQPMDLCTLLFSESLGRFIVEVEPRHVAVFLQLVPHTQIIGTVTDAQALVLPDGASISMQLLLDAWQDGQ